MKLTKEEIKKIVVDLAEGSALNRFKVIGHPEELMWREPMVGFSSGEDDYFKYWKKDIGDFYWSPSEAFALKFNGTSIPDSQLTVMSIGFPQTYETMKDQARAEGRPSLRWSASRGEWEPFIQNICKNLIIKMEEYGIKTVAIDLLPGQSRKISKKYGLASTWSHRHTAFVCGLGTFGLSDGLITRQGKAMRFSTLIIHERFEPDQRPYTLYNEWCLYYADGTCGKCIERCPVGAITKKGHDKVLCDAFLQILKAEVAQTIKTENIANYYGCGLCQSRIPCQQSVPVKINEPSKEQ